MPLSEAAQEALDRGRDLPEGTRRWLGLAFGQPASLLDYLPDNSLIAFDEVDQCQAHSDRWVEHVEDHWQEVNRASIEFSATEPVSSATQNSKSSEAEPRSSEAGSQEPNAHFPKPTDPFDAALEEAEMSSPPVDLSEMAEETPGSLNLASRPIPAIPHQFGKLAETIRGECKRKFAVWLVSAQPSRSVALLQEHDCPAQFIPNPKDYNAIDKLQTQHVPVAVKYSGLAELEGFVLPTFRIAVVTDREFFGQHTLATPGYVRKRRRAASKQVDPNKMKPGDFVVHRSHGIGKFIKLESLTLEPRNPRLSGDPIRRWHCCGWRRISSGPCPAIGPAAAGPPVLNKMTSTAWEKTKGRAKKAIQKVAVDLLKLYAQRAKLEGFAYPTDMPWQQELEDSFPYQPTPDQLKAVQDVKRDMESDRPMDRLVCGDVGFGKTEVAIRAIFKAVTAGKQVALLAPTTILTQQHYHTLKERFAPYPIQVGLLNRFRTAEEKKEILQRLKTGELDVVVGTHQLLGKTVTSKTWGCWWWMRNSGLG
jgi:transcription-repair coupling factor (superfamily II helicase)